MAIYSGPDDTSRLHVSVWDVEDGRELREFSPMSSMLSPSGEPLWWNNGRWLLAGPEAGKGIWDVSTGRFQGSLNLSGCDARESLVILGENLQQRCFAGKGQDGKVLEWSLDGIERQLADFASQISDSESPPE